ncbi:MAG: ATP-binding protein [Cyanobacteria bacterium J06638_28]
MLLLNDKHRKWASLVFLSLGGALAINTAWRSLHPPEVVPLERLQQIQAAMQANEAVVVPLTSKSYLNTLLIKMMGATSFLALAAYLSPRTPKTLEPDAAHPAPPPDAVEDEVHADFLNQFKLKVAELARTMPWLIEILKAQIIVIVGEPGTGKSSVAQSIALFRLILFATGIDIVDPDWDNNVLRQTWLCGRGIGSEAQGPFSEQLREYWSDLKGQTYGDAQGHCVILDELSRWTSSENISVNYLEGLIQDLYQRFRRKNIWSILLLHGLQQEYNFGNTVKAGTLTNLYPAAAVIKLEQKKSTLGEAEFAAMAKFKPPGHPYTGDTQHWQDITIPREFHAAHIIKLLGEGANYFGIGLSTPEEMAGAHTVATMRDLLDESITSNGDLVERLHRIAHAQIQPGALLPEDEILPNLDALKAAELQLAKALHAYLATKPLKPDGDGFYLVREIWRNWGSKQKLWSNTEAFKTFLDQLQQARIGTKKQVGRKVGWRFLKGFQGG